MGDNFKQNDEYAEAFLLLRDDLACNGISSNLKDYPGMSEVNLSNGFRLLLYEQINIFGRKEQAYYIIEPSNKMPSTEAIQVKKPAHKLSIPFISPISGQTKTFFLIMKNQYLNNVRNYKPPVILPQDVELDDCVEIQLDTEEDESTQQTSKRDEIQLLCDSLLAPIAGNLEKIVQIQHDLVIATNDFLAFNIGKLFYRKTTLLDLRENFEIFSSSLTDIITKNAQSIPTYSLEKSNPGNSLMENVFRQYGDVAFFSVNEDIIQSLIACLFKNHASDSVEHLNYQGNECICTGNLRIFYFGSKTRTNFSESLKQYEPIILLTEILKKGR